MTLKNKEQECKKCGRVFGSVRCFDVDCPNNIQKLTTNQEHEELLLKDLCARLLYRPKIWFIESDSNDQLQSIWYDNLEGWQVDGDNLSTPIYAVKPYLFPLSSMTDEQKKEYRKVCELDTEILSKHPMDGTPFPALYNSHDWLNKNHFDYRGLIPMGLAIDATGQNVY